MWVDPTAGQLPAREPAMRKPLGTFTNIDESFSNCKCQHIIGLERAQTNYIRIISWSLCIALIPLFFESNDVTQQLVGYARGGLETLLAFDKHLGLKTNQKQKQSSQALCASLRNDKRGGGTTHVSIKCGGRL